MSRRTYAARAEASHGGRTSSQDRLPRIRKRNPAAQDRGRKGDFPRVKLFAPTDHSALALYWPSLKFRALGANKGVGVHFETCFVFQRDKSLGSWLVIVRMLGFGVGLSVWEEKGFDF